MTRVRIDVDGATVEAVRSGDGGDGGVVCAAHPADAFGDGTAACTGGEVVCVNPRGVGGSSPMAPAGPSGPAALGTLTRMVDDIEAARVGLGFGPWTFWGMSGGGWLALLYAHRHPRAASAIVVESACLCFRARLADPACVLSPRYPAWREALAAHALLPADAGALDALGPNDDDDSGASGEWIGVAGVGAVFRRRGGPALVVAPGPLDDAMRAVMPALLGFDARPWASALRVPALVIAGTADPVVPIAHARAVHEALAGSTVVAVEGAGHVPTSAGRPEVAEAFRAFRNASAA